MAPKRITRKLRGLQSNLHTAYINKEYAMLNAAFNSVAGFDDGSDTPKTHKDVLQHRNQNGWWDSMKKGALEIVHTTSMPPGRKVIGNRWVYNEKDKANQELLHKVSVRYLAKPLLIVTRQL
jgi:hypothetical protein